jgi:hypothetical protein
MASQIENSQVPVSEEHLKAIADALEISPAELEHFHEKPIFSNCPNSVNSGYTVSSTINYVPVEKLEELYRQLIAEKDKHIAQLEQKLKEAERRK